MKKAILLSVLLLSSVIISYGQWNLSYLSEAKQNMGSTSLGTKAYFAGGQNETNPLAVVEFYNTLTGEMGVIDNLSVARVLPSAGTCRSCVFFAGGANFGTGQTYANLDIWDTLTQQMYCKQLSVPRFSIATVSKDDRILFAGGYLFNYDCSDMVDIYDYDSLTGFWTHSYDFLLSEARAAMASAVVGDLAIFAGGVKPGYAFSDRVDIYNFTTNSWSTATLSQARGWASATTVDDKVLIAGGLINMNNPSDRVDIYNATTGIWEDTDTLSIPRCSNGNSATAKGKAYFAGGGNFSNGSFYSPSDLIDIYYEDCDIWSTINLIDPLVGHSVVGVGNKLIVAGGYNGNDLVQTVEILEVFTDIKSKPTRDAFFILYPNPCNTILTINTPNRMMVEEAIIYNQTGQKVVRDKPENNTLNISKLQHGLYIIEMKTDQGMIRKS